MFCRTIAVAQSLSAVLLASTAVLSQTSPAPASSMGALELPVTMRQSVVAGKTPVGTKVQATLAIATLVDGVVVPREAVLSGEVTESVAKTKTDPSRLSIRMDMAQWKNGSAPVKAYLTAWYYPAEPVPAQNLSYQPRGAANSVRNWNGMGQYPDEKDPSIDPSGTRPFPSADSGKDNGNLPTPAYITSKHRVLMKDVDAQPNNDGAVTLTANRSNIKIDKLTTYILATPGHRPKN